MHITLSSPKPYTTLVNTTTKKPVTLKTPLSSTLTSSPNTYHPAESIPCKPSTETHRSSKLSIITGTVLPYTLTHYTLNQHQKLTGPRTHQVSLLSHPVRYNGRLSQLKHGETIVLGDLHGSSQKLLEHLIITDMVRGEGSTFKESVIYECLI
ncbi:MAG: hypothetical protein ACKO37_04220 [Vampirovibrionales bacterium]